MDSNVLRFDFEKMARLAKENPQDFAHKREELIRQLIDRAPRAEHLIELQRTLNRSCVQLAAPGLQLGFLITDMMLLTTAFMTAHMTALNGLMQGSLSNRESGTNHEHSLV